jgi:hypothetical protein
MLPRLRWLVVRLELSRGDYLTVRVPSMPAARCSSTLQ